MDLNQALKDAEVDIDALLPSLRQFLTLLFNKIEEQANEISALKMENQKLRDEVNRLKGEQGKPDIRPQTSSKDFSSEKERKEPLKKKQKTTRSRLTVPRDVRLISRNCQRTRSLKVWLLWLFKTWSSRLTTLNSRRKSIIPPPSRRHIQGMCPLDMRENSVLVSRPTFSTATTTQKCLIQPLPKLCKPMGLRFLLVRFPGF